MSRMPLFSFFFFNDTATTEIYTLSLHDALPICINGLLTVVDVSKAEAAPNAGAILATVDAGCSPVRLSETADATTLWVTVRGDDRVLAFDTAKLESHPNNALLGFAATGGTAPVGARLFHNDQLLAVANSNRFLTGTANATIL